METKSSHHLSEEITEHSKKITKIYLFYEHLFSTHSFRGLQVIED